MLIFYSSNLYSSSCNRIEQLTIHGNNSGVGFALHSDIVMPYITNYGSREQVEKYIPRMMAGTCIGAIAMTEPGAGRSD